MNEVEKLMQEIAGFDCDPSVFNVGLERPSYLDCFVVCVTFRKKDGGSTSEFTVRNENPVKALEIALAELKEKFGKCPHCNNYLNHAK